MKIVVVSDTHTRHEELGPLSGDVLIHCGDFSLGQLANPDDVRRLDDWFRRQSFEMILCTGGNHDFGLEQASGTRRRGFANATYLEDTELSFQGVKFYGAPWTPELRGWAFYQDRRH